MTCATRLQCRVTDSRREECWYWGLIVNSISKLEFSIVGELNEQAAAWLDREFVGAVEVVETESKHDG